MEWDGTGLPGMVVLPARSAQQPKQPGEMARLGSSDPSVSTKSKILICQVLCVIRRAGITLSSVVLGSEGGDGMGSLAGTAVKAQGAELGTVLHP